MLIEVHIIQNHAPSNLNRDDSGSPKTAMFGGYRRARISSQCLKRCYRTSKTFRQEVDDDLGLHTRSMADEVVRRSGIHLGGNELENVKKKLAGIFKDDGASTSGQTDERGKTAQSVFWRDIELSTLAEGLARAECTDAFDPKSVLQQAGLESEGVPVDMALFGRMVASPLMRNVEASSQFAHAISTHEFVREFDLWTRVDDRRDKRLDWYKEAFQPDEELESGTDGMGDAEFTSPCYYSYFNVDFDGLIDNLTGKALNHTLDDSKSRDAAQERACKAVIGLVKAAVSERPTGKFNSMASPLDPTLVLVEIRDSHVAMAYTNAFAKPVDPKNEENQSDTGQVQRVNLPLESARRLISEANRITKAFNRTSKARVLFTGGIDLGTPLVGRNTKDNSAVIPEGDQATVDKVPFTQVDSIRDLITELTVHLGCPQED